MIAPVSSKQLQLQRERRPNHFRLIARRDVAVLDPLAPVSQRLVQKAIAQGLQRLLDRLAPREGDALAARESEGPAVEIGQRQIGRQPQFGSQIPRTASGAIPA